MMMKTYGLVGYPLEHSFSKKYFTEKFDKENIEAEYLNFELEDISDIREKLSLYPFLAGFNVTIPHKENIVSFLDEIDWGISSVKAVNTVKVLPDGRWKGFNTDVIGFERSIMEVTDLYSHESALILGSGGASKAVQLVFQKYRVPYCVISRTPDENLFEMGYADVTPELLQEATLIINTTPLGMYPHIDSFPDIDYSALSAQHVCMDLVYNPEETSFLKMSRAQNAMVLNGYKMLVYQAEASYKIWNDDF